MTTCSVIGRQEIVMGDKEDALAQIRKSSERDRPEHASGITQSPANRTLHPAQKNKIQAILLQQSSICISYPLCASCCLIYLSLEGES
jgi:hypothetical protein